MRTRTFVMMAALLLVAAGGATAHALEQTGQTAPAGQAPAAQPAPEPAINVGSVDFGVRGTRIDGDPVRYQRYRDLRNGGFLDGFRFNREEQDWLFSARADHVGYRDQRFAADYDRLGKLKASFEWNQIPLFFSEDTRTLYTSGDSGVLRIDDGVQLAVQNSASRQPALASFIAPLSPFDVRLRRDIATFNLMVTPKKDVDVSVNVTNTKKAGQQPWGASFSHSNVAELAVPIDHRTTDVGAAVEWSSQRGLVKLGWDGSWFNNNIETLIWDNPVRLIDTTNSGPGQGREPLWPSSTTQTVSGTGSINLPAHSRALAYISVGSWSQDQSLVPYTINSAFAPISLDRQTADAKARVTSATLRYTARPSNFIWFNANYRLYDFDNKTKPFHQSDRILTDQSLQAAVNTDSEPFSYKRQYFDADVSFTPWTFVALKGGYGVERDHRTFRFVESTTEHTIRGSIDSTGNQYVTVRAIFEHSERTGTGLDEEVLDDIGEQVSLRQFDISDRNRNRVTAVVQVTPIEQMGITGSIGAGKDNRPNAGFGLRSNENRVYSIGFDVVPSQTVAFGLNYGYDDYKSVQNSRQALPPPSTQFDDPTRNWETDGNDYAHTLSASVDLTKAIAKTDIKFAYDLSNARATYVYVLPANSSLSPVSQLPPIKNDLQRATADVRYFLTSHVALGLVYAYDRYRVNDFTLDTGTIRAIDNNSFPSGMLLGYVWRPYTAHSAWARVTYLW